MHGFDFGEHTCVLEPGGKEEGGGRARTAVAHCSCTLQPSPNLPSIHTTPHVFDGLQVLSVDIQVMPYAYVRAAAAGAPYSPADSVTVVVGDPWPGGARAQVRGICLIAVATCVHQLPPLMYTKRQRGICAGVAG